MACLISSSSTKTVMKSACKYFFPVLIILAFAVIPFGELQAQGIDVSKYQGTVNYRRVAKTKSVKFVYIRATEGSSIKDAFYRAHLDSARAAGLYVGSYHVYSSKTPAESQFRNFKSVVVKKYQDLIPVLDIEGYHSGRLDMAKVDKLLSLMEKEYGAKPMIYTSEKVYQTHFTGKKYAAYHIFVAKYKGSPSIRYTLWQHSKTGRVSGVKGDVDLDKFHPKHSLSDILLSKKRKKASTDLDSAKKADSTASTDTTAKSQMSKSDTSKAATPKSAPKKVGSKSKK